MELMVRSSVTMEITDEFLNRYIKIVNLELESRGKKTRVIVDHCQKKHKVLYQREYDPVTGIVSKPILASGSARRVFTFLKGIMAGLSLLHPNTP